MKTKTGLKALNFILEKKGHKKIAVKQIKINTVTKSVSSYFIIRLFFFCLIWLL